MAVLFVYPDPSSPSYYGSNCWHKGRVFPYCSVPPSGIRMYNYVQKNKKITIYVIFLSKSFRDPQAVLRIRDVYPGSRNYRIFYPKNCHYALKNIGLGFGIRDPRFWIRKKPTRIPDPGSQKAPDTGYGFATLPTRINFDPKLEAASIS